MAVHRMAVLAIAAIGLGACDSSLPVPDYVSVKTPPPWRTAPDGTRIDNEDFAMDAQGYRTEKNGGRAGDVDVSTKMGNEASSAMAGFYVSSTGTTAPGRVMAPSEGATAGAGYGPGSAGFTPAGTEPGALPPTTTTPAPPASPATGTPTPLR